MSVARPTLRHAVTAASGNDFGLALRAALRASPRSISPKYLYDAEGARLFEEICTLPEYYPTRTETAIYLAHAGEMAAEIGEQADIVEFGAGAMTKIRILLQALADPIRYVPVDISVAHLEVQAGLLTREFPALEILPVGGDFTQGLALPPPRRAARRRVGFFPGSSIGNFGPAEARQFLQGAARMLRGGGLLIGVDLPKDPALLHAAYNDAAGVTARFNLNLLTRANRELGTDFVLPAFAHYAFFNPQKSRIEMHLVSRQQQTVRLGEERFGFAAGESLHTENSHKYRLDDFRTLAREAGFEPRRIWCDPRGWFSVHWLAAPG